MGLLVVLLWPTPAWSQATPPPAPGAGGEIVEYYATDALGSIRVVFTASGAEVARADYLPFGERFHTTGPLPPQQFTGQQRDPEAQLDHFNARSYQTTTGRFTGIDPVYAGLFQPQKWNRYSYALANPLKYVDPLGLDVTCTEIKGDDGDPIVACTDDIGVTAEAGIGGAGGGGADWWSYLQWLAELGIRYGLYDYQNPAFDSYLAEGVIAVVPPGKAVKGAKVAGKIGKELLEKASKGSLQRLVETGEKVFRVWGDEAKAMGKSWTTVDPRVVPNYRNVAGLPNQNSGRFLSEGVLVNTDGVVRQTAVSLHGNVGGLPELVVPMPDYQIILTNVMGLNPKF